MSKIRASQLFLTLTAACALALTACGGGGGGDTIVQNPKSRADEGVWINSDGETMHAVILDDGSYWRTYGIFADGAFSSINLISHGTASINGNNVSGAYSNFPDGYSTSESYPYANGTYSGTVSAKNSISLTFNDPTSSGKSLAMNYDGIFNQPASLAAISGTYLPGGTLTIFCPAGDACPPPTRPNSPNLTISGSSLTLLDGNGEVAMTGTIAPHGTTVNVFDVSLTTTTASPIANIPAGETLHITTPSSATPPFNYNVPAGAIFNGILFQTSDEQAKNYIEIVTSSGDSAFYFMGSKQN